jgi:hypothetical protein
MSRRRRHVDHRPEADRWSRAYWHVRCAFGCAVIPGTWIRFGRNRSIVCAPCARQYWKLEPPEVGAVPVTGRDRQLGDDV